MKMNKVTWVEDYKIGSSFQSLRKTLWDDNKFAGRREKPLAYWALPNDRRLPLAFLGRTIKDLLATPFEELSATPGIGQKKIRSFVKLLSRAANTDPSELPVEFSVVMAGAKGAAGQGSNGFDPASVSESGNTENNAPQAKPAGEQTGSVVYHVGAGRYVFESTLARSAAGK